LTFILIAKVNINVFIAVCIIWLHFVASTRIIGVSWMVHYAK